MRCAKTASTRYTTLGCDKTENHDGPHWLAGFGSWTENQMVDYLEKNPKSRPRSVKEAGQ